MISLPFRKIEFHHPEKIFGYALSYPRPDFDLSWFSSLEICEPEFIQRANSNRLAEYVTGRYCAALAIRKLSGIWHNHIPSHERRPLWPKGIIGSITHSGNISHCVVAAQSDYSALGIDCEKINLSVSQCIELMDQVLQSDELSVFPSQMAASSQFYLAFSAKETVFKAFDPFIRQIYDFNKVRLTSIDPDAGKFTYTYRDPFPENLNCEYRSGSGGFQFSEGYIHTFLSIPSKG